MGARWATFEYGALWPARAKGEQDAGDGGVDLLVVFDLTVAQVEERLPADVTPGSREAAQQVVTVIVDRPGKLGRGGVEDSAKKGSAAGLVESPVPLVKLARYEGRTMLWPKR